jgi:putative ABC transport system permease protein
MSLIRRAVLNLVRSPLRTLVVTLLLAVSIGLALIMASVHGATQSQMANIQGEVGTEITIRAAGSFGPMGGGEPLAQEDIDQLSEIDHVASVQESVQTRYTGTSLESAVDAGTIGTPPGDRPGSGSSSGGAAPPSGGGPSMGITVMGFSAATEDPTLMGGSTLEVVEGSYFTSDDADVMVIGQDLADKNSLDIGSTVDIEGTSLEVIGFYDSGTVFGNNMIVMPIGTAERVFELDGVTSVTVVADDANNVDEVVTSIREVLPEDVADITTAQDMYERIGSSVTNANSTSTIAMIVAFVVAGVVVLFSVLLMVRQRVKEIGILKAIGASNWRIGLQFSLETLAVSVVGAIVGAIVTYPLAEKVYDLMVGSSSTETARGGFGGGPGGMLSQVGGNLGNYQFAVSPVVFLYAVLIAAGLAILASALPAWYIARVRPAEVLRNE